MSLERILELIPQRYPFMLIDQILEYEKDKYCTALKNLTYNEAFFQGHFPGNPIMPGVLILEAMAQTSSIIGGSEHKEMGLSVFASIDKAKFRRQVIPGDQLLLKSVFIKRKLNILSIHSDAYVRKFDAKEYLAATADFKFAIVPIKDSDK